jgi:hypothetical protein
MQRMEITKIEIQRSSGVKGDCSTGWIMICGKEIGRQKDFKQE